MKRNTLFKIAGIALAALGLALVATGAGAADTGTNELHNETLDVSNDTQALHVSATESNDTLDIAIYGIDDDGDETEVDTSTLDATDEAATYEYENVDPEIYDQYRVVVTGDGADDLDVAKVELVGGGGGFLDRDLGGLGYDMPAWMQALGGLVVMGIVAAAIARYN